MEKIVLYDGMSVLRERLSQHHISHTNMIRGIINETQMTGMRIWTWDGIGGNDARRKIFPAYKSKRPPQTQSLFEAVNFIRKLLDLTPAWQARIDGFEGDDLIAALVDQFPNNRIEIQTRDGDLVALTDGSRVTCTARLKEPVPPHFVRLYKLMVGDQSDSIPGVKGYGKKSWFEADKFKLAKAIDHLMAGRGCDTTDTGLTDKQVEWIRENLPLMAIMDQILRPLPIPLEQVNGSLWKGTDNPQAREELLRKYLL